MAPPGKKRSVSRTAPSLKLRAASVSPRSPITISVEPPPMSTNTPLLEHRHRLQHAEVDQPCLLDAGDHLDLDLRLRAWRGG